MRFSAVAPLGFLSNIGLGLKLATTSEQYLGQADEESEGSGIRLAVTPLGVQ